MWVFRVAGQPTGPAEGLTRLRGSRRAESARSADQDVPAADGQLIRTLTPELVDKTRTSSARPEITARPNPAGMADPPSWPPPPRPVLSLAAAGAAGRPVAVGAWSLTVTTNRSSWSVISILTGSAGQCR